MKDSDVPKMEDLLLILQKDSDSNATEEAQWDLEKHFGSKAIPSILKLLPDLSDYSKLCAIQLIQACDVDVIRGIANPTVAETLLPLLESETYTGLQWTARALGWIGDPIAIPALFRARKRADELEIPINWPEQVSIRRALTLTGGRQEILPPRMAATVCIDEHFPQSWPLNTVENLINALADAKQALLYFMVCVERKGPFGELPYLWYGEQSPGYELDYSLSWPNLVEQARDRALIAASRIIEREKRIVTLEWINESDL